MSLQRVTTAAAVMMMMALVWRRIVTSCAAGCSSDSRSIETVAVTAAGGFDVSRWDKLLSGPDPQDGSVIALLRRGHFDSCQTAPRHGKVEEGILLQHVQEVGKVAACFFVGRSHE